MNERTMEVERVPAGSRLPEGHSWLPHEGERARKRRLRQMAQQELKHLRKKHGTTILLNGRTPGGVIVEPVRARNFDNGIIDLQEHQS